MTTEYRDHIVPETANDKACGILNVSGGRCRSPNPANTKPWQKKILFYVCILFVGRYLYLIGY